MARKSCYDILGVARDADVQTIALAHRQARSRLGADADPAALQLLDMAYDTLSRPASRARHDTSLASEASRNAPPELPDLPTPRGGTAVLAALPPRLWMWTLALALLLILVWLGMPKRLPPAPAAPTPAPAVAAAPPAPRTLTPAEIFERNRESVVVVAGVLPDGSARVQGSGVTIAPEAVVTNCHVAGAVDNLQVTFQGHDYEASLRYRDTGRDLCQLQVNGLPAKATEVGSLATLRVGERVYALGAPQGLDMTLSEGLVSGLRPYFDSTLIQTSAAISPGSSGGGLYDQQGRLVGITTFQAATGQNLNFAVPADWIAMLPDRNGNSDRFPDPAGFH